MHLMLKAHCIILLFMTLRQYYPSLQQLTLSHIKKEIIKKSSIRQISMYENDCVLMWAIFWIKIDPLGFRVSCDGPRG